MVEEQS